MPIDPAKSLVLKISVPMDMETRRALNSWAANRGLGDAIAALFLIQVGLGLRERPIMLDQDVKGAK